MANTIAWTPEDKGIVATKLKEGLSARAIGLLFGRSRNAVIGVVGRDPVLKGIGFGRSDGTLEKGVRQYEKRDAKPVLVFETKAREVPSDGVHTCGVPLMALKACQCRYPVNDAERGELHLFCAAPSDGVYCQRHTERSRRAI